VKTEFYRFAETGVLPVIETSLLFAGAGGERQWVSRLKWLMGNRRMSRLRVLAKDRTNRQCKI